MGPEKMPTCKYFLEGCCVRDSCPYLHVKVSAKADICKNFLCGYCPDGQEVSKRVLFFSDLFIATQHMQVISFYHNGVIRTMKASVCSIQIPTPVTILYALKPLTGFFVPFPLAPLQWLSHYGCQHRLVVLMECTMKTLKEGNFCVFIKRPTGLIPVRSVMVI